jgi:3-methyladenine DNA glycosylase Mpg
LARHLEIARDQYGADLTGDMLYFLDNLADRPTITVTRRVGVDYAGQWKDAMLRFFETGNRAVSRPWR